MKPNRPNLLQEAFASPPLEGPLKIHLFLKKIGLLNIKKYKFLNMLGGGGTNFTALYGHKGELVVAKFFIARPDRNESEKYYREIKMLKLSAFHSLRDDYEISPKIVHEFQSRDRCVKGFLMEYIEGKSLESIINEIDSDNTVEIATSFYRAGWAVHHSLRGSIVHKDLHPGNIIFEMDNTTWTDWVVAEGNDGPKVRILDFGSAVVPLQFSYDETFDELWIKDLNRNYGGAFYCIAPEFLLPNFLHSLQYGSSAFDCWAMGLILYRLCTKKTLDIAKSIGDYAELIYSGNLESKLHRQIDQNISNPNFNFLVKHMLQPNYKNRVNFFSAICYINFIRLGNQQILDLRGPELYDFVFRMGCNPEHDLPPHERSNSPY